MLTSNQSTLHRNSSASSLTNRSHGIPSSAPHQRLKHQPSLIDLIDDTTLTSLPLPPPPKKNSSSRRSRNNSVDTIPSLSKIRQHTTQVLPYHQQIQSSGNIDFEYDDEEEEDEVTFEGDESQDPIVLIEDYMINSDGDVSQERVTVGESSKQSTLDKKKSLANFKQRMYSVPNFKIHNEAQYSSHSEVSTIESSNSNTLIRGSNKRAISGGQNSTSSLSNGMRGVGRGENFEEIFGGKIPGSDLLKYCDICEKPLYEISSLLGNYHKKFKTNSNRTQSINSDTRVNKPTGLNYNEFICWECIEIYEDFFNELEQEQNEHCHDSAFANDNSLPSSCNRKLLSIFKSIQEKYNQKENTPPPNSSSQYGKFSNSLILRLNSLKNSSSTTSGYRKFDLDWLKQK
ncbi:uncharacterized protein RJT21DRAFT_6139 [Scheffersomyces amazonensis]|uniref:uncharacterized protein n=1 Tax=Scheffersomyces amazonensis TaxID=1078765 RepID=UPI00315C7FAA